MFYDLLRFILFLTPHKDFIILFKLFIFLNKSVLQSCPFAKDQEVIPLLLLLDTNLISSYTVMFLLVKPAPTTLSAVGELQGLKHPN